MTAIPVSLGGFAYGTRRVTNTNADYEKTADIQVAIDGVMHEGRFRVMSGSVIVYYGSEIKFAPCGMDRPETVARWLLSDLCRKVDAKTKKRGTR
ncbi:hypothetical protein BN2476_300107 [Paraburkholderia piptadeniae]|uniref:Uncharacterized protein n=1 Tax=Paraburkholderia piptadeniae TaxID=1701573 RepID=A0A1N7S3T7_9BURK|nr:hypothetical protein BN2476_300107 [Paraburkholderia piptadeniae]